MEEGIRIDPKTILYNDIVFRSATEARWAMYFDEMGIKYKYEPRYIALAEINQSYLPDFYLPDLKMYIEIKRSGEYSFTYTKIEGDWTEVTCENSPGAYQRIEKYLYAAEYFLKKRCLYLLLMGDPLSVLLKNHSEIADKGSQGILFDNSVCLGKTVSETNPEARGSCGKFCKDCADFTGGCTQLDFLMFTLLHLKDGIIPGVVVSCYPETVLPDHYPLVQSFDFFKFLGDKEFGDIVFFDTNQTYDNYFDYIVAKNLKAAVKARQYKFVTVE